MAPSSATMTDRETIYAKLLPLLLAMTTASVAIAVLVIRPYRAVDSFYNFVTVNRDTMGFVVQIISAVLGACQVYAVTSTLNLSSRLRLQSGRSVSSTWLKLCASVTAGSIPGIRSRLPGGWMTAVILVVMILKFPAALWAGSLTPLVVDNYEKEQGTLAVATFPTESSWAWSAAFKKFPNGTVDTTVRCGLYKNDLIGGSQWSYTLGQSFNRYDTNVGVGLVALCPAIEMTSGLLGSVITASSGTSARPRVHARVDGMGWTYLGRSYGVGESAGLIAPNGIVDHQAPIEMVIYTETGYETVVSCSYNESSAYGYGQAFSVDGATVQFVVINGTLPNSDPGVFESYPVAATELTNDIALFGWSTVSNKGVNMLAVTSASYYKHYDKAQCTVEFHPTNFQVTLNITDKTIMVSPLPGPAEDIEPTGVYSKDMFYSLELIARLSGTTMISVLATPIDHGRDALKAQGGPYVDEQAANTVLKSLENGIASLLDDLLVTNAQSQLYLLGNRTDTPLKLTYRAIRIGSDKYIYAALVTNMLVLTLIVVEIFRTRFWRGLDLFDYTDIQAIAEASSAGGHSIDIASSSVMMTASGREGHSKLRLKLEQKGRKYALYSATDPDTTSPNDGGELLHLINFGIPK